MFIFIVQVRCPAALVIGCSDRTTLLYFRDKHGVYEYMEESKLTSIIPRLLLDVLIADEKAKVRR